MSDTGRKDFSTKAEEAITPESTKSTTDKIQETVTGTTDRVSATAQPEGAKSAPQSAFDTAREEKDEQAHGSGTKSVGEKVKSAVGLGDH